MAGGGSRGADSSGGSSITLAWSLRSELAMRSEEQPSANKHLGEVWHRNGWRNGLSKPAVTEFLCLCILEKSQILFHIKKKLSFNKH